LKNQEHGKETSHAIFSISNARKAFVDLSTKQLSRYRDLLRDFARDKLYILEENIDSFLLNGVSSTNNHLKIKTMTKATKDITIKTNILESLKYLSRKRKRYSVKEKSFVVKAFHESKAQLLRDSAEYSDSAIMECLLFHLHNNPNYLSVDISMIWRWIRRTERNRTSRLSQF
jgi:hypothetical protein